MKGRAWQMAFMVVLLFGTSVLLAGCPKKPAPAVGGAAGAGAAGTGAAGGAGAGGAGGAAGTTPGTIGTGPSGASGAGAGIGTGAGAGAGIGAGAGAGAGGGALATGTTIPALPTPKEFAETSALRDIHFDFDKYEVRSQDKTTLDENASWLKQNAASLLLIEGHADERGTNEYNLALGERRAKSTRDYLVSVGIEANRITVISYGEERPLCTERTEACWAQNRRAHFLVKQ